MFEAVCDCCGKRKDLNVYILRIERISDPSIAIRYDMRDAEVIPSSVKNLHIVTAMKRKKNELCKAV